MKTSLADLQTKPEASWSHWDDLRLVLALARGRTLQEAARRLRSDPSTVFRRARAVEKRMGVKLFERSRQGYLLTEAGEDAAQAAERVEAEVLELEARVGCRDVAPSGTLRVTTTDTILNELVLPSLPAFTGRYPEIRLELAASTEFADLTKRDADVAIRPTRKPPEHLVGRALGAIRWAVYAQRGLARPLGEHRRLESASWIGPDEALAQHPTVRWRERRYPKARVTLSLNSMSALRRAIACGLGVGVLPCFLGDPMQELVRVGEPIPELDSELWVLTHRDYRNLARVRAFFDFARDDLAAALAGQR